MKTLPQPTKTGFRAGNTHGDFGTAFAVFTLPESIKPAPLTGMWNSNGEFVSEELENFFSNCCWSVGFYHNGGSGPGQPFQHLFARLSRSRLLLRLRRGLDI